MVTGGPMRFPLAVLLAGLAALPAVAGDVHECDFAAHAANIAEPWETNTRTFANGAVRIAVLDTTEPAAAAFHLLILSPPYAELGLRQCRVVSFDEAYGYGSLTLAGMAAGYDPAIGLTLELPITVYNPETALFDPGLAVCDDQPGHGSDHGRGDRVLILGVGTDLCNIERIEQTLERFGDRFRNRVFTETEQRKAERRKDVAGTYAKRWAAKEACSKALGTGLRMGIAWKDMAVSNLRTGQPVMHVTGWAAERLAEMTPEGHEAVIHVTLTDDHPWAQAFVVIEALPVQS